MTNDANLTPGRELSGKVVLVTGAARNIGRAIASALAAAGADVMVNALHSREDLDATVRAIGATGRRAAGHIADVTDPDAVAGLVTATIERFGRIDALVNNAAVRPEQPFAEMSYTDWRRVLAVVLTAHSSARMPACRTSFARAAGRSSTSAARPGTAAPPAGRTS